MSKTKQSGGNALEQLIGVDEASVMIGRTRLGLHRLVERGEVPFRKAGRRTLFIVSELQEYIGSLPGLSLEELVEQKRGDILTSP